MDTGMGEPLEAIIVRLGPSWQIGLDGETGVWVAVERPTPTAVNVIVGRTLAELATKLDAEGTVS